MSAVIHVYMHGDMLCLKTIYDRCSITQQATSYKLDITNYDYCKKQKNQAQGKKNLNCKWNFNLKIWTTFSVARHVRL